MIGLVLTSLYTSSRKPTLNMNSGSFSLMAGSFALAGNLLFAMLLTVELSGNKQPHTPATVGGLLAQTQDNRLRKE